MVPKYAESSQDTQDYEGPMENCAQKYLASIFVVSQLLVICSFLRDHFR